MNWCWWRPWMAVGDRAIHCWIVETECWCLVWCQPAVSCWWRLSICDCPFRAFRGCEGATLKPTDTLQNQLNRAQIILNKLQRVWQFCSQVAVVCDTLLITTLSYNKWKWLAQANQNSFKAGVMSLMHPCWRKTYHLSESPVRCPCTHDVFFSRVTYEIHVAGSLPPFRSFIPNRCWHRQLGVKLFSWHPVSLIMKRAFSRLKTPENF